MQSALHTADSRKRWMLQGVTEANYAERMRAAGTTWTGAFEQFAVLQRTTRGMKSPKRADSEAFAPCGPVSRDRVLRF